MKTLHTQSTHSLQPIAKLLLLTLVVLIIPACKTTRQVKGDIEPSGFLGDYSQMTPGQKGQADMLYISQTVNWSKYTKVLIKPLELWKSDDPESPIGKISSEDQQMLASVFMNSMIDNLSKDFQIVDQPGPDVLIIRAAMTDGKKSKPVANFVTSVYLPLKLVSLGKRLVTGTDIAVGAVTVEADFIDSLSNQRVAAVMDRRAGTKALRTKFNSTWGDVKINFDWWAQRLATRLAEEKAGAITKTAI